MAKWTGGPFNVWRKYLYIHILSLIKENVGYLFGACWLFVTANISPPSLHPLLLIVLMKPYWGGVGVSLRYTTLHMMLLWIGRYSYKTRGIPFSKNLPNGFGKTCLVCFHVKMNVVSWINPKKLNIISFGFISSKCAKYFIVLGRLYLSSTFKICI